MQLALLSGVLLISIIHALPNRMNRDLRGDGWWKQSPRSLNNGWLTDAEYVAYIEKLKYISRDGWNYVLDHHGHAYYNMFEQTANCTSSLERYPLGMGTIDGGKYVCDFESLKAPCIIYSIGSNGDYLFEEAMLPTGCQIFTFDCTGDFGDKAPAGVTFKKWCVAGKDEAPFYSVPSMMKMLGHERIDYLKMDVEGAEFFAIPALKELPKERRPKQFGFELHTFYSGILRTHATMRATMDVMMDLHELGYRLVSREDNKFGYCCSEFLYILV